MKYDIILRCSSPYTVEVENQQLEIYSHRESDMTLEVRIRDFEELMIGKNTLKSYVSDDRARESNMLLVKVTDHKNSSNTYMYIGDYVYTFTSREPFTKFVCPIDNHNNNMPYAITNEYIYFLNEKYQMRNEIGVFDGQSWDVEDCELERIIDNYKHDDKYYKRKYKDYEKAARALYPFEVFYKPSQTSPHSFKMDIMEIMSKCDFPQNMFC